MKILWVHDITSFNISFRYTLPDGTISVSDDRSKALGKVVSKIMKDKFGVRKHHEFFRELCIRRDGTAGWICYRSTQPTQDFSQRFTIKNNGRNMERAAKNNRRSLLSMPYNIQIRIIELSLRPQRITTFSAERAPAGNTTSWT